MGSDTLDVSNDTYDEAMKAMKLLLQFTSRQADIAARNIQRSIQRQYDELMRAANPQKAAKDVLEKSYHKMLNQASIAHVQGGISDKEYLDIQQQLKRTAEHPHSIEDASVKIATLNGMEEFTKNLNREVLQDPHHVKEIFKDYAGDMQKLSRIPEYAMGRDHPEVQKTLEAKINGVEAKAAFRKAFSPKGVDKGRGAISHQRVANAVRGGGGRSHGGGGRSR